MLVLWLLFLLWSMLLILDFDASISEYSFEFDTEESAPEEPVPPQNVVLDYLTDSFTDTAKPRPRGLFKTFLNYATPLTRAPPIA